MNNQPSSEPPSPRGAYSLRGTDDGLQARWEYRDTDGTGILIVSAQSQGFAGSSSAWFSDADVTAFADRLAATYPLSEQQFRIRGGYQDPDGEHVGITV